MQLLLVNLYDLAYTIATLVLVSAGLALAFGLMRIINLAHGEFITVGGYATILASQHGINIWVAMLLIAPLVVGLLGAAVELLLIRHLYGRTIDTLLATWGLSLALTGLLSMTFGATTTGVPNPLGAVPIGDYSVAGYGFFVIAVATLLMLAMWLVLKRSRAGLLVRGAMQSPDMAAALGHPPRRIYQCTFIAAARVAGLAGGVLAPLIGIAPTAGGQFVARAFITVITGGASVVTGTLAAGTLLGTISKVFELLASPVVGEIALLLAALALIRWLPRGITSRIFRNAP